MIHADIIGERARLSPRKEALSDVATGSRLSYADLDARAVACARMWLYGLGLKAGDRIGILANNQLELIDAFCAAGKCGVILVPLSTKHTAAELAGIIADCGLSALMYSGQLADVVGELRAVTDIEYWIALDERIHESDCSYRDLLAEVSGGDRVVGRCHPEDPYCLLYTSGTTGRPKGVIIPHRQVAWNAYNTALCWQLGENDTSPIFTPLYHAGGLGAFLTPILAAGGRIVLVPSFDPAEVWRVIEEERCTVVLGVPTIWSMLAEDPQFARADLGHVRWFISGGAPLPKHLIEVYRTRGVVLRQGYGLTEVGVNCFAMSNEEAWNKAGSIGRPLMFTEARVIDESGTEKAPGEVGELCFRGPHVCSGYWKNPEATAEAMDAEGWFHTGDMAVCDSDGFFFIAGRAKDMFISGGVNVYPAEVENQLLQHNRVRDAAVIGVAHPKWGEVGVAFVVLAEDAAMDPQELAEFLGPRLARYKIPRRFVVVGQLPRTPYGKVVKSELLSLWEQHYCEQGS